MNMDLFDCIDARAAEYKGFLRDIVNMNSCSSDKADVDAVGAYISRFASAHGFSVERTPFERAGDGLTITYNESGLLPAIAFTGHMDTVFPKGTFEEPLFREKDGLLYGPGVVDMKGGIAVGLLAMQALLDVGYRDRPVKLVLIGDEELSEGLSGEAGKDFIRNSVRGCAAAITLEPAVAGKITVGRKGSIRYRVHVTGRASHAGMHYADGVSAIKEAAHKILRIEEASDPDEITYNCGLLSGGTSPNTVPGACEFTLYNRYWRLAQRQEIREHVEGIVAASYLPGTRSTFEIIGERPPMEATAANLALCEYLHRVSLRYGFSAKEPRREAAGSDAAYTSMVGVPSVCSMGMVGGRPHSTDEFAQEASLYEQAKLLAAAIRDFPAESAGAISCGTSDAPGGAERNL